MRRKIIFLVLCTFFFAACKAPPPGDMLSATSELMTETLKTTPTIKPTSTPSSTVDPFDATIIAFSENELIKFEVELPIIA